uniref:Uncharacterized protein n=1 Tax=Gopherus evgoodei TaxID=1825980 RepID=A0A8C4WRB3_9SAUR
GAGGAWGQRGRRCRILRRGSGRARAGRGGRGWVTAGLGREGDRKSEALTHRNKLFSSQRSSPIAAGEGAGAEAAAEFAGSQREPRAAPAAEDEDAGRGDPGGRAGEAQRQPLPVLEEEAGGADQGQPESLPGRAQARPGQGAGLPLHPQGGLRGAHGQVHLLHHRHHGPQGDRLPLPGPELLERLHHHGAHRLPEQAGHPGLQEPPGAGAGGGQPGAAPDPGALSSPRSCRTGGGTATECTASDRVSWTEMGQGTNEGKQRRWLGTVGFPPSLRLLSKEP